MFQHQAIGVLEFVREETVEKLISLSELGFQNDIEKHKMQIKKRGSVIIEAVFLSDLDTQKKEIIEELKFLKLGNKFTCQTNEHRNLQNLV